MRAMAIRKFGGPEVFEPIEIEKPTPARNEILVRVVASGTNPVDAKIRQAGKWAGISMPAILGYDASGVVEGVGADVEEFAHGSEVFFTPEIFGNSRGTYAEYVTVPAAIVHRKPKNLDHYHAAAIPLAGGTAYEAIVRRLQLRVGETILIQGGAGGVGSFAVQIARAAGARVLASASTISQHVLRQLGVDVPIDYTKEDPTEVALRETANHGVDAVLDTVGGDIVAKSAPGVRPFGRLASIVTPTGDLSALHLRNQTLHGVFLTRERARLAELCRLCERHLLKPVIADSFPLLQVSRVHQRLDSGHGTGKVILRVTEP